jgi:hypothetical protein
MNNAMWEQWESLVEENGTESTSWTEDFI